MKWCSRALLNSPIRYGLCLSPEQFNEALRTIKHAPLPYMTRDHLAATYKLESGSKIRIVVCLDAKQHKTDDRVWSTLVHEAVHVWQAIREYIGEGDPAVEQEAYCIERIASNLIAEYRKATKLRSEK